MFESQYNIAQLAPCIERVGRSLISATNRRVPKYRERPGNSASRSGLGPAKVRGAHRDATPGFTQIPQRRPKEEAGKKPVAADGIRIITHFD